MSREDEARLTFTCSQDYKDAIQKRCYWERKTFTQKQKEMWDAELATPCADEPTDDDNVGV